MSKYICEEGHLLESENLINMRCYEYSVDPAGIVTEPVCPICKSDVEEAFECPVCGEYFTEGKMSNGICDGCADKLSVEEIVQFCNDDDVTESVTIPAWITSFFTDSELMELCIREIKSIDSSCQIDAVKNFLYNYGDEFAKYKEAQNG